jgi:hypothetical protein
MLESQFDQKAISYNFQLLLKIVLCSSYDGVPSKFKHEKWASLQFTSMDRMSLVSDPL